MIMSLLFGDIWDWGGHANLILDDLVKSDFENTGGMAFKILRPIDIDRLAKKTAAYMSPKGLVELWEPFIHSLKIKTPENPKPVMLMQKYFSFDDADYEELKCQLDSPRRIAKFKCARLIEISQAVKSKSPELIDVLVTEATLRYELNPDAIFAKRIKA